jgi:hypothetical protein
VGHAKDHASQAADIHVPNVTLRPPAQFEQPHVSVSTDGTIDARAVADAYGEALAALRAYAHTELPGMQVADPIDHIVAVPQDALCEPRLYLAGAPPSCSTIPSAVADAWPRTLAVVADPSRLPAAMRKGVADAVCVYQPVDDPDPKRKHDRITEICVKTNGFLTSPRSGNAPLR